VKFKEITIENFRNFEYLKLNLTNKNVIFGLNDIGKTNFLCAIRFLLDRDYRRYGFLDSDYFQKNVDNTIKITLEITIEDGSDDDNKIFNNMKGIISSTATSVFIQLKANYLKESLRGEPNLYWGSDMSDLVDIPSSQAYYDIDRLFNIVYIDSSIQLENIFKRYTRELFRERKSLTDTEWEKIKGTIKRLNNNIAKLTNIKRLEGDIKNEYRNYRNEKDLSISIRSEIELDNIHSKLTPYICYNENKTYPTSGDGRRKILSYTLLTMENRKIEEKKINIFLIEELENHLHRSMQIALSHQIFTEDLFRYMFMTTHSSLIVSQMDDVNLIKLYKSDKTDGKSQYYKVPKKYITLKQKLNQNLADAIYANVVLLVEGPSEKILFEKILKLKCNQYESLGGYILEVDGINFIEYYKILMQLDIKTIVKTDNDLKLYEKKKEYNLLGLNRCLTLIGKNKIVNQACANCSTFETDKHNIQTEIFKTTYKTQCEELRLNSIYISQIDLENDLYEAIPDAMDKFTKKQNTSKTAVDYLQSAKMINICNNLTKNDCNIIYSHPLFACIKELIDICNP
jgi:putative ATP-dependent endonuclease of OLD family